jgi:hypothetical protein
VYLCQMNMRSWGGDRGESDVPEVLEESFANVLDLDVANALARTGLLFLRRVSAQ